MKLYYCQTPDGNFGDDMNLWFWDTLIPGWRDFDDDWTLCGIGTLIGRGVFDGMGRVLVCGSGTGYGRAAAFPEDQIDFAWVRGPLTASRLQLDPGKAITDPACMVTDFPQFAGRVSGSGDVVFVPHRLTANLALDWDRLSDRLGFRVISPKDDSVAVISALRDARLVIAESMHAAIIADAFRTPWIPVAVSHHFNTFKWQDWADGMEVPLHLNTALRGPRAAYFFLRRQRAALRSLLTRTPRIPAGEAPPPDATFHNPNYMQKDERDQVKALVARFSNAVEALLARDLKRIARLEPSLSSDTVLADRKARIAGRVAEIEARFRP